MSFQPVARSATKRLRAEIQCQRLNFLPDGSLQNFRNKAFAPELPVQIPKELLPVFPATSKWFKDAGTARQALNDEYLKRYGAVVVPLEITSAGANTQEFARVERPLSDFLSFLETKRALSTAASNLDDDNNSLQIYLAQCPISSLPPELGADVPTPPVVMQAGRGDVYDSSIWIGLAPTYTPLHKDPNPNLFVQLAGRKVVRLFEPHVGAELYAEAQRQLGRGGSAALRGEEMMQGEEKQVLDAIVWPQSTSKSERSAEDPVITAYEVTLGAGEGIFIPKGWWHSIKGVGNSMVGSANWWFR